MKLNFLIALSIGVLSSCMTLGNKFDTTRVDNIIVCKTTESELLSWFGEPRTRANDNGYPLLYWGYASGNLFGGEAQNLYVSLNRHKIVTQFQLNPPAISNPPGDTCR